MELAIASRYLFTAKEYPKRYAAEKIRRTTGIIFCVLFFFLLLYRPFGVYEPELKFHYAVICLLHALSPSIILYAYFTALNYLVKRNFFNFRWNLFREYCLLSVVIFLIGIASFLMRDIIYDNP